MLLPPVMGHAQSLPTGATVTHGQAALTQSGSHLLITQASANAILSWDSFSVGGGARTHFDNGTGATLNRVTGSLPSSIDGSLTATGSLYLVNSAGIAIGTGGMVRTGGTFLGATHDVSDADFLGGGDMVFSGTSKAGVVNEGTIASLGGDVVLTARRVENTGTILAAEGDVGLLAGYEVLLRDLATDEGRFAVRVGGSDTEVVNTGTVRAANAELRANGGNVYALAGNTQGVISATGVRSQDGRIFLTAGEGGAVTATQRVVARPAARVAVLPANIAVPPERPADARGIVRISADKVVLGGQIDVSGDDIPGGTIIAIAKDHLELTANASLDASGGEGGLILLGGDFQGGAHAGKNYWHEALGTTKTTLVAAGATIRAEGTSGAGGDVVVWGDGHTGFAGHISATGVTRGGDAEVSGKATLAFSGTADLRASSGAFGTLLLDPYNITIIAGAGGTVTGGGFTATGNDSVLGADTLLAALDYANVVVQTGSGGSQAGNITVNADLSWFTTATLTLDAANTITLNNAIAARAGGLTLNAGGLIDTGASGTVDVARFALESGNWVQYAATLPGFATGDFRINGGSFLRATGGAGTTLDPYMLADVYGLQGMATHLGGHFALASDIDASGTSHWWNGAGFVPIGRAGAANRFTGSLDGQGHVISSLVINRPTETYVGLFGDTHGAVFANVGLQGGAITGRSNVGGLAGYLDGGAITASWADSSVTGEVQVGGLVGTQMAGSIGQSWASGAVTGAVYVGGLVGSQGDGSISQSFATGAVTGGEFAGGLLGLLVRGSLAQSWASGAVSGNRYIGGLVGHMEDGTLSQTWSSGAVSGQSDVGGLLGSQWQGSVISSFWDRQTTGQTAGRGAGSLGTFTATGLTTVQARSAGSYSGWDFVNVWYRDRDLRPVQRAFAAPDTDGDGAYEISTLIQLQLMDAYRARDYVLTRNLDATFANGSNTSGLWGRGGFVPVGRTDSANSFTGSFDGQGHVISNLTINRIGPDNVGGEQFVGLFGRTFNATIRNIGIDGGTISGDSDVGGLVGYLHNSNILQSWSNVDVDGFGVAGGLVGYKLNGGISQSWTSGSVSGHSGGPNVGGLAGYTSGGIISQSWSSSAVTAAYAGGQTRIGGLVGRQNSGTITQSWASGRVTAANTSAASPATIGGLVGLQNTGTISQSWASGRVVTLSSNTTAGGLLGSQGVNATVTSSFWDIGTTGQETSAGGAGAIGLTTAQFRNTAADPSTWLVTRASAAGWDFDTVWYQGLDLRPIQRAFAAPDADGDGVHEVSTLIQLQLMDAYRDRNFVLTRGIDAYETDASRADYDPAGIWGTGGFVPIGRSDPANGFTGRLDGQGHAISALTVDRPDLSFVGLFGFTVDASIENVGLDGAGVRGRDYVGALVGLHAGGNISRSWANGAVWGNDNVGGLVGNEFVSIINQSWASIAVSGSSYVGGLVGRMDSGRVDQSWASGAVTGNVDVGGLVGHQIGTVSASFWDIDTTTRNSDQGRGGGSGAFGATGLTTAQFQDTASFMALAQAQGWDFQTVWARPGADGPGHYPVLYGDSNVVAVEAGALTRIYGDTGSSAIPLLRYHGLQAGDFLRTGATMSGMPGLDADVGTYALTTAGGATTRGDYRFVHVPGTVTISPRAITVTAADMSRIYGEANPALTWHVGGMGLVGADTLTGALASSAGAGAGVGSYAITQGTLDAGANYVLTFDPGTLTVTPRAITVSATDLSRIYGEANPAPTWHVGGMGLVGADTLTGALAVSAGARSGVGSYAITQGTLDAGANYAVTFDAGTLRVTPRAITITADGLSKLVGQPDPTLAWTLTAGSLAAFDSAGEVFSGNLVREVGETVGAFAIGQGTLSANANYDLSFMPGILAIEPAAITPTGSVERALPRRRALFSDDGDEDTLALCRDGSLPEDECLAFTHPANRTIDFVRFGQ